MAAITKVGVPSLATAVPCPAHSISGRLAGEAIAAGDACYIKASDGKVWRSTGAAANAAAKVRGFAAAAASVGEAVTLMRDVTFRYGSGLTPGADVYLASAAGSLQDSASTGGTAPIGYVVDDTRIRLWDSRY